MVFYVFLFIYIYIYREREYILYVCNVYKNVKYPCLVSSLHVVLADIMLSNVLLSGYY